MAPLPWVIAVMSALQCQPGAVLCLRGVTDPRTGQLATFYAEAACVAAIREICHDVTHSLSCTCVHLGELGK